MDYLTSSSTIGGFPTFEYEVTKTHHKRTWLKQKRLLILRGQEILNAKPRPTPTAAPVITKNHHLRMVELIALKSKRSFMLRFSGDHDYFYSSPHALEIVWEVNKRRGALRAVEKLAPTTATHEEREALLRAFAAGALAVPHSDRSESDAVEKTMDVIRAVRGGAVDGVKSLMQMSDKYAAATDITLSRLREELTEQRASLVHQLVTRQRSLSATIAGTLRNRTIPSFEDEMEATVCAEEVIQTVVVSSLCVKLWSVLQRNPVIASKQAEFETRRRRLAKQDAESFGLRPEFSKCNLSLPLDHLEGLRQRLTPCDMMNILAMVAKSLVVSLQAPASTEGEVSSSKQLSVAADDMLPLMIYTLSRARQADCVPFLLVREWIENVGDPNECTERAYYFTMYSSAVEYIFANAEDESDMQEEQLIDPEADSSMAFPGRASSESFGSAPQQVSVAPRSGVRQCRSASPDAEIS